MVNYNDGKIYKIVDNTNGNIYIGSTAEKRLCRRLQKHLSYYKGYLKGITKTKISSFNILSNGDYKIYLLETYPCNNKDELHMREQHWIDRLDCINVNRSTTNPEDTKKYHNDYNSQVRQWKKSWGGDFRSWNNNLLKINPHLFQ